MDSLDIDPNFEPQTRARSNTWPLPRPENYAEKDGDEKVSGVPGEPGTVDLGGQVPKKNSSRRNAWGNMSYADLITQAIQSSPDKRLTLSQIYDWMVQNVPYFKDKGDSNSSAGWKNSIRHNLSLHNRFMRVQNEGTGKSSWWMINPDAKPGKAARRRATSMETQKYEKKRGRVKKKVEALRNGLVDASAAASPSSSVSEGLDVFPESPVHHGFQLSPDFRPRASSNASSCSRLSPIPVEADLQDSQLPPLSPLPWAAEATNGGATPAAPSSAGAAGLYDRYGTDQLVDTLAETMKLGGADGATYLPDCGGLANRTSAVSGFGVVHYGFARGGNEYRNAYQPADSPTTLTSLNNAVQRSPPHALDGFNIPPLQALSPGRSVHSMSPPTQGMEPLQQQPAPQPPSSLAYHYCAALARNHQHHQHETLLHAAVSRGSKEALLHPSLAPSPSASASLGTTASQVMGHLLSLNNALPNDLDLNFDSLQGGLECDVDQVIHHELSVDGNLDFNFDPMNATASSTGSVPHPHPTTVANRPWVH